MSFSLNETVGASVLVLAAFTLGRYSRNGLQTLFFRATSELHKMALVVRTDLKMGQGKIAAQCAHAAVAATYEQNINKLTLQRWLSQGQPKVVLKCKSLDELDSMHKHALKAGINATLISDAGRTQLSPGTNTVLAVGPGLNSDISKITGHLKLL